MFPKSRIACAFIALTWSVYAPADCPSDAPIENDPRIGFNLLESDEEGGVLDISVKKLNGVSPGYAMVWFIIGDQSQGQNAGSTYLRLKDEGDVLTSSVTYLDSKNILTVRVVASYPTGMDCELIIANEWKHNQSKKAPAPQAGTH